MSNLLSQQLANKAAQWQARTVQAEAERDALKSSPAYYLGAYLLHTIEAMVEVEHEPDATHTQMADGYIKAWQKLKADRDRLAQRVRELEEIIFREHSHQQVKKALANGVGDLRCHCAVCEALNNARAEKP